MSKRRSGAIRTKPIWAAFCLTAAYPFASANATVLEYDNAGQVTVTLTHASKSPVSEAGIASSIKTQKISTSSGVSKYRDLTRQIASRYSGSSGVRAVGLDALSFIEVFELLIQRESAFNPKAVSEKGAKGLGQLMPGTASDLGVTDPFDPEQNLIGAAKYFTLLLKRFGKLEYALAAYNAGPERVKKYGGVPPFRETQAYVDWIMANAGLKPSQAASEKTLIPAISKTSSDTPLKGNQSVWEF